MIDLGGVAGIAIRSAPIETLSADDGLSAGSLAFEADFVGPWALDRTGNLSMIRVPA